jgi:hypothetical protein
MIRRIAFISISWVATFLGLLTVHYIVAALGLFFLLSGFYSWDNYAINRTLGTTKKRRSKVDYNYLYELEEANGFTHLYDRKGNQIQEPVPLSDTVLKKIEANKMRTQDFLKDQTPHERRLVAQRKLEELEDNYKAQRILMESIEKYEDSIARGLAANTQFFLNRDKTCHICGGNLRTIYRVSELPGAATYTSCYLCGSHFKNGRKVGQEGSPVRISETHYDNVLNGLSPDGTRREGNPLPKLTRQQKDESMLKTLHEKNRQAWSKEGLYVGESHYDYDNDGRLIWRESMVRKD